MPYRRPPYLLPGDPGYTSDQSPRSSSPPSAMSEASYDEYGQPRAGGVGQGAPLDSNGWYIYSQIGEPIIATPPSPSLSVIHRAVETNTQKSSRISENTTDIDITSGYMVNRPSLKRRRFDNDFIDSPPQTPRRRFGGSLTNTPTRAKSMPLVEHPRAPKRRRLQAPFDFSMGLHWQAPCTEKLEEATKELGDVKAVLARQTEILQEILGVLREGNTKY